MGSLIDHLKNIPDLTLDEYKIQLAESDLPEDDKAALLRAFEFFSDDSPEGKQKQKRLENRIRERDPDFPTEEELIDLMTDKILEPFR